MSSSPPADHSSAQSPSCPFPAELLRLFGGANCFFQAANAAIKGTDGQEHQQDEADQQQEPNGSLLLSKFPSEESASTSLRGSPNEEEAEGEAVHDENSLFETIAKLAGIEPGLKEETEERRTGEEYAAEESGEVAELGNGSERADSGGELAEENNGAPKGVCPLRGLLGTLTPSSSSSRRKSCMPTRIKEESEEDGQNGVVSTALADVKGEAATNGDEELRNAIGDSPVLPNGQPAGPQHPPANPFAHFPSTAVLFPQFFQANSAHLQQQQQFARMAQSFRDEMLGMGNGTSADDKHQVATGDFSPNNGETQQQLVPTQQAHAARLLSALVSMQQQQMEQMGRMASAPGGGVAPSLFGGRIPQPPFQCPLPQFGNNPAFFAAFQQHPLIAAAMAAMAAASNNGGSNNGGAGAAPVQSSGGGIFPPQHQLQPGTWPQTCHPPRTARCPMGFTSSSLRLREPPTHLSSAEDGSPRKKRAKVTDSVRGPRSSLHRELALANSSYSERSSPSQQQYPPTMVAAANAALAAQNSHLFALRHRSPHRSPAAVSGQEERAASCNNLMDRRPTLTHVHLKKAKLMFFYQRYPSSTLLKSYFPDVHFNKHNTAQLVKWFSNFREFFYMQMEKYAKQALGDGMRDPNEIFVSTDSEVFKQLQQHYNKNSAFQPPESLLTVVEQTLREFFVALQQGRDSEPSWKKQIYKVIQQLDEPIPEYFREPQFVELLEQS